MNEPTSPSSLPTPDSTLSQGKAWRTAKQIAKVAAFVALGAAASAFTKRR